MGDPKRRMMDALFSETAGAKPKNIDEYNAVIRKALDNIVDSFGLGKVEYFYTVPQDAPFDLGIPDSFVLYDSGEELGEPVEFVHTFAQTGAIRYVVFPLKSNETFKLLENTLFVVFQYFYHNLNVFLLDALFSKLTTCDLFTGIPNLSAFFKFCGKITTMGNIGDYTAFNFNIRNFKSIHNSLSYIEGNKLMETYCHTVYEAVSEREIVAHMGGDNFVAVILNENRDYFLDLIGNMVVKFRKGDRVLTFSFGATVGALKLKEEKNPGEIMMHISAAYQAARASRSLLCYYDKNAELGQLEQKTILSKFAKAIVSREFKVMYQPKVSVKDKELCGAEALVRWVRQDGGVVMPGSFIPVLENDGCICTLDFYMLEEVCRFQRRLLDDNTKPVKISVNFSKRHLANNKLVEEIVETIDRYQVPHEYIEIELTESEDFHNNGVMKDIVDELGMRGIKTSIDDFGTGYSSLGMLRTLTLDTLKIDRSFIPANKGNIDEEKSMLMLKGVVDLAKSLGLTTVAEGVETPEQLELLRTMNCDIIQGYIFDKPLPEEEFVKRLKQRIYVVKKEA